MQETGQNTWFDPTSQSLEELARTSIESIDIPLSTEYLEPPRPTIDLHHTEETTPNRQGEGAAVRARAAAVRRTGAPVLEATASPDLPHLSLC